MLIYAVSYSNYPAINSLLKRGADVNIVNSNKFTALHLASYIGDFVSALMLLEVGARVNLSDANNMTPLMYAVLNKDRRIIQALVNYGADVDIKNGFNESSIDIAKKIGDHATEKFLREKSLKEIYSDS